MVITEFLTLFERGLQNMKCISEIYRSRVLLALQTTATGAGKYAAPTPGVCSITLRAIATMGHDTDLVLSLNYADNATGTNATAFPENVPIFVNGVRGTDAKSYTIGDATGDFIVDFCIDPATIPEGKLVGLAYANSDEDNLVAAEMIEDVAYKPA
jgi:hypothetical protein